MVQTNSLQRKIMRRVYYTFAMRLMVHPVTIHVGILAVIGVALARLVHVAAVYESFSQVPVGEVGAYLLRLVTNADTMTLAVMAIAIMTALSLRFQLRMPRLYVWQPQAI